jgi:hypothetical protein
MHLFKKSFKTILASCALSAFLISCGAPRPGIPIEVKDYVVGGYLGPAGGPGKACREVHTLFTEKPGQNYDLQTCLQHIIGKVYLPAAALNEIQTNVDAMCTSLGSCTYEQEQRMLATKAILEFVKQNLPMGNK